MWPGQVHILCDWPVPFHTLCDWPVPFHSVWLASSVSLCVWLASSVSLSVWLASSVSHSVWLASSVSLCVWPWPVQFHSVFDCGQFNFTLCDCGQMNFTLCDCDRNGTFYGLKSCLHRTWELSFDAHRWTFSRIYCYLCSFCWPNNSFAKLPFVPLHVKYVANLYCNHRQFRSLWLCSSLRARHLSSVASNSLRVDSPPRHPPLSKLLFLSSLAHVGNSGSLSWVRRKSSASHCYQCVQYFHASTQWFGCQCWGLLTCAQMLMRVTAHRGLCWHCKTVHWKWTLGEKALICTRDLNPRQHCAWLFSQPLYQLSRLSYGDIVWVWLPSVSVQFKYFFSKQLTMHFMIILFIYSYCREWRSSVKWNSGHKLGDCFLNYWTVSTWWFMQNVGGLTLETKVSYELTNRISDMLSINRWRCRHAVNQPMALQTCCQSTNGIADMWSTDNGIADMLSTDNGIADMLSTDNGIADMLSMDQRCCRHAVNQPMVLQSCCQSTNGVADMQSINQRHCWHAVNQPMALQTCYQLTSGICQLINSIDTMLQLSTDHWLLLLGLKHATFNHESVALPLSYPCSRSTI